MINYSALVTSSLKPLESQLGAYFFKIDTLTQAVFELLIQKDFFDIRSADILKESLAKIEQKYQNQSNKIRHTYIEHHTTLTVKKETPEKEIQSVLQQSLSDYSEGLMKSTFSKDCLSNNSYKINALRKIVQKNIFSRFHLFQNSGINLPIEFISLLYWLDYGLTNFSFLNTSMSLSSHAITRFSNPPTHQSFWSRFSTPTLKLIYNYFNPPKKIISNIIDMDAYLLMLNEYIEKVKPIDFFTPADQAIKETLNAPESRLQKKTHYIKTAQFISKSMILAYLFNQLEGKSDKKKERFDFLLNDFIIELNEFINIIIKKTPQLECNKSIQEIKELICFYEQNQDTSLEAICFLTNKLSSPLSNIASDPAFSITKPIIGYYSQAITHIRVLHTKMLELFKKVDIGFENAPIEQLSLKFIDTQITQASIAQFDILGSSIETPSFANLGYEKTNMICTGGSQKKAPGTGFYRKENDLFFIKRTTRLSFLEDDLCEILATSISQHLNYNFFAECTPVKASNDVVYIASKCADGFTPIMDMSNRKTTRLIDKSEKKALYDSTKEHTTLIRNIIMLCAGLGETDPNPGNLGKTLNGEIIKIDHGWCFDKLCAPGLPSWRTKVLNPFRYKENSRIAPTNALNDYSSFFNEPYDFSIIERVVDNINQKPDFWLAPFMEAILNLMPLYNNSKAIGALKPKIQEIDIIKALCNRFGIDISEKIPTLEEVADKFNESLCYRFKNLYLFCLLENIALVYQSQNQKDSDIVQSHKQAMLLNHTTALTLHINENYISGKIPFCINMQEFKKIKKTINQHGGKDLTMLINALDALQFMPIFQPIKLNYNVRPDIGEIQLINTTIDPAKVLSRLM